MKYDVHVTDLNQNTMYGVEIRPPIADKASDGVCASLLHQLDGYEHPDAAFATQTRNDDAGTAFFVESTPGSSLDAEYLANRIGTLINPCALNEVELHFSARPAASEV